jgi:hypothetical protein
MSETTWIIERENASHAEITNCVIPNQALGTYLHCTRWGSYEDALRFSRKIDAERAAKVLVPDVKTVACEHTWN